MSSSYRIIGGPQFFANTYEEARATASIAPTRVVGRRREGRGDPCGRPGLLTGVCQKLRATHRACQHRLTGASLLH